MRVTLTSALAAALLAGAVAAPAAGGVVVFAANPHGAGGVHGHEPYRTDGTPDGTRLIEDINPGRWRSSHAGGFTSYRGLVYFAASSPQPSSDRPQRELWRSDGTKRGTRIAVNLHGDRNSETQSVTRFRGRLYFSAKTGRHGNELRKSDGTRAGTKVIREIRPGGRSSNPRNLVRAGRFLYFTANDGQGRQLWRTDGTTAGTKRLTSVRGTRWERSDYANVKGTLFFFAGNDRPRPDELWKSDGTRRGTRFVRDIDHWYESKEWCERGCSHTGLTGVGNAAVFLARDDLHGVELWKSGGTRASTRRLTTTPGTGFPSAIAGNLGREGLFVRRPQSGGAREIWITDGTRAGTRLLRDVGPAASVRSFAFANLGGRAHFFVYAGDHELWRTDGTIGGTESLGAVAGIDWLSGKMRSIGGLIYFVASTNYVDFADTNFEPWRSDGTPAGTFLLKDIDPERTSKVDVDDMAALRK